jgi:predicted MPP superfamily phosphohydrolase
MPSLHRFQNKTSQNRAKPAAKTALPDFGAMLFLSFFLTLTLLSHVAIFRFILRWLGVTHPFLKTILLAACLVMGISFMAAFLLLRWTENPWTILYFRVSAVWFALSIKITLAAGAAWSVYAILRIVGIEPPSFPLLASACIILALGWSAHGFYAAFHPIVKHLDIPLERLPDQWRGRTVVQLSDVHLGHFHGPASMERLADRVNALHPDLVVITGDFFDGMIDGMSEFESPLKRLKARHGVFLVTGNHESYAGLQRCLDIMARTGIRVLFNEVVEIDGLHLMGVAYPGIHDKSAIRGFATAPMPAPGLRPCILLFHTPTDIRLDHTRDRRFATYFHPDTSFALSKELGVSLQLSGHSHQGQIFPFNLLTKWIYNGYDYGLHQVEGFAVYTSSGVGTWGPPIRSSGAPPEIVVITLR